MQPDARTIGIMGAGVVGGALRAFLELQGHDVRVYDPPKGYGAIAELEDAEIVFICVPTPYTPGRGFDDRYLLEAIDALPGPKLAVIKSTVVPGTTELMQREFPQHRFVFNPEFLRESTANEDFINPDRQIVGCTAQSADDGERLMRLLPRAPFELICNAAEAEMAKYVANSFLAVKVIYANETYDLCHKLGIDFDRVKSMVTADQRIGGSHMDVFDAGYRGYGGKCLPKDSKALLDLARAFGVEMRVLDAADRSNAVLRAKQPALRPVPAATNGVATDTDIIERAA